MVDLTCPHCQNSGFEAGFESVAGISERLNILRCAACAAPIGILASSEKMEVAIGGLSQMLTRLHHHIEDIQAQLNAVSGGRTTGGQANITQAGN